MFSSFFQKLFSTRSKKNTSSKKSKKKSKKISKLVNLDEAPSSYYHPVYFPKVKKIKTETGLEEKFGGSLPFFKKGESWPSIGKGKSKEYLVFLCQFRDPRNKKNELIRVFMDEEVTAGDSNFTYHGKPFISKIDLDLHSKNQDTTVKNMSPVTYSPFEITQWKKRKELISYNQILEKLNSSLNNNQQEKVYQKYSKSKYAPSPSIKIGGTPIDIQGNSIVEKFNLIQLTDTDYLPFEWGDGGVANINDKLQLYWACH